MSSEPKNKKVTLEDLAATMQQGFKDSRVEMQHGFREIRSDVAAHDQKFDELIETINKLPTREEVQIMIDRTYDIAVLKAEHNRLKEIIREKLHVEI